MKTEEKIEAINIACEGSVSITHFMKWELSSYKVGSLFGTGRYVKADSFIELIDKAYDIVKKKKVENVSYDDIRTYLNENNKRIL